MITYKARNQEKGVLAKGVSAESSVTPKETKKYPRILGPAEHLAFRAPQPRETNTFAKPPSKTPLFLVPDQDLASRDPFFWPLLRRSARAPTIKAVFGTAAIKGVFDN